MSEPCQMSELMYVTGVCEYELHRRSGWQSGLKNQVLEMSSRGKAVRIPNVTTAQRKGHIYRPT